jgi:hypothetical protein
MVESLRPDSVLSSFRAYRLRDEVVVLAATSAASMNACLCTTPAKGTGRAAVRRDEFKGVGERGDSRW